MNHRVTSTKDGKVGRGARKRRKRGEVEVVLRWWWWDDGSGMVGRAEQSRPRVHIQQLCSIAFGI